MAKKALSITPVAGTKNRVIVQAAAAEEKTAGGIIIPDTAKEKPQRGTVMAVSSKDEDGNTPVVKEGNTVLYGKYAGTEITVEGVDYLIMRESDILAII
jgi:chaperonin GroES